MTPEALKRRGEAIRASKFERQRFELYARERRHIQMLWDLCAQPIKFPARRRRSDREVPKAA